MTDAAGPSRGPVVRVASPADLVRHRAAIERVCDLVFREAPWWSGQAEHDRFLARLRQDLTDPSILAVLALDVRDAGDALADRDARDGEVVGMAYGRVDDYVTGALREQAGFQGPEGEPSAFEFMELALDPAYRGAGLGGRLHDALMGAAGEGRPGYLLTRPSAAPAVGLYRGRGWYPVAPLVLGPNRVEVTAFRLDPR
ncbi:GNAT family N-acetyltransferase [Bailinhaonella thermotolerans]|uniref:GNAT family N-acetyltransferase n=1 Tax=Bailinhaonella thermotolerans TaxID=1070861 RepID=UPI0011C49186|nr:GNAT family N-acetyltransferase [Bailinhaonella thermotolerans]